MTMLQEPDGKPVMTPAQLVLPAPMAAPLQDVVVKDGAAPLPSGKFARANVPDRSGTVSVRLAVMPVGSTVATTFDAFVSRSLLPY